MFRAHRVESEGDGQEVNQISEGPSITSPLDDWEEDSACAPVSRTTEIHTDLDMAYMEREHPISSLG